MSARERVAVVGGGLGGLAAAAVLAARGHRVRLYEKNAWLGGKAAVLHEGGYRFDMGPTILTLPSVLKRIFAETDRPLGAYLPWQRLDPQWRCFFADGSRLDLLQDPAAMAAALDAYAPGGGAGEAYRRFLAEAERLDEISERFFLWRAVEDLRDTFDRSSMFDPSTLRDVWRLRMGSTVASVVRGHVKDRRVAQMIDHFTQYVGSSPYQAPAVLCSIAHMQVGEGIWYPEGGTRAVADALVWLGREHGAEYVCGADVVGIETEAGAVTGLRFADGTVERVSAVVSNMDAARTYRELLRDEPAAARYRARRYEPACSGIVLYLGLRERYEHLAHHNFVFSSDPEEEFRHIYRRGRPAPDPTAYVAAPSVSDPSVAPAGGEALYVLVHVPYLRPGQDWRRDLPAYREVILDKLEGAGRMEGLKSRIAVERALTPHDLHARYRVLDGAIYGLASHGRVTGAFKPGNRSRAVRGLYLAGGAAHPGPGMPMVMMSGWIAAAALDADLGGARPEPARSLPVAAS